MSRTKIQDSEAWCKDECKNSVILVTEEGSVQKGFVLRDKQNWVIEVKKWADDDWYLPEPKDAELERLRSCIEQELTLWENRQHDKRGEWAHLLEFWPTVTGGPAQTDSG
mmetsp:Transcript_7844/g.18285  ORF Transcript_7844/g.18285 Transcript_7844/m.18285 type:complete len:110 (-) Transcript_7844:153-482(-)